MTETTTGTLTDPRVIRAIELIWQEATLLDDKDYERWQELYTDDGIYVIPIEKGVTDFKASLNMVYDDKRMRAMRVERMVQGYAPSAVAAAATVRTVSRFTMVSVGDEEVRLRGAQIVNSYKRSRYDTVAADVEYTIRLGAEEDRIALKVVRLLNSEDPVNAAGFLL